MHANNVTRKDLERPVEAMFSAGLKKMTGVIGAMRFLREQADLAEDRRKLAAGVPEEQVERERELANKPMRDAASLPLWQRLTGLTKDRINDMGPDERRRALNRLYNAVRLLLSHEIALNESGLSIADADGAFAGANTGTETDIDNIHLDAPAPRTHLWDPIREVCHFLQIAKAALSRFLIEASGMSAIELVDAIKAKNVKARMRTVLFPALKKLTADLPSPLVGEGLGVRASAGQAPKERARMALWKRLKDSRRNPDFQRAIYAIDLGFSSHQRMYRACVLAHRKTPSQLEWELIDEFLTERERADSPQSAQREDEGTSVATAPVSAIADEPPDSVDDGNLTHQIA